MTSSDALPYASPQAFRRALTDKLRAVAASGPWPLADLQRQFAYDRLLLRLYRFDDGWIVKGATALLARHIAVRHTVDLDVYRAVTRHQAESDLRAALTLDPGDWFTFEAGRGVPIADGAGGVRIPVEAYLGTTVWSRFHVDVVADGIRMTGTPDETPSITMLTVPGLDQPRCRAYPLVDHIADKTIATFERHGAARRPSTRFKDLIDLVVLVSHARTDAMAQRHALLSEAERCAVVLPASFDVPDRALWERGYRIEAGRALVSVMSTLDGALDAVRPYLDPILSGTATGRWNPTSRAWNERG